MMAASQAAKDLKLKQPVSRNLSKDSVTNLGTSSFDDSALVAFLEDCYGFMKIAKPAYALLHEKVHELLKTRKVKEHLKEILKVM